jgi:uncharacterized protein YjbI with pentapeptide repeats
MARYSKEQVLEKVRKGESLERADLKDLDLDRGLFENANLERADLEGVSLRSRSPKEGEPDLCQPARSLSGKC